MTVLAAWPVMGSIIAVIFLLIWPQKNGWLKLAIFLGITLLGPLGIIVCGARFLFSNQR